MNENRLSDYLDHMQQASIDVQSFVDGLDKDDFLEDKRTQQAVIMSLIIMGEASTKVMDDYAEFSQKHSDIPWRNMRGMRNRIPRMVTSISTLMWYGTQYTWRCRTYSSNCRSFAME